MVKKSDGRRQAPSSRRLKAKIEQLLLELPFQNAERDDRRKEEAKRRKNVHSPPERYIRGLTTLRKRENDSIT